MKNYYTDEQLNHFRSLEHLPIWNQGWSPFEVLGAEGNNPSYAQNLNQEFLKKICDFLPECEKIRLKQNDSFLLYNISKITAESR